MSSKIYAGGVHSYSDATAWTPTGAPQTGDAVSIGSGTVTATGLILDDQTIELSRYKSPPVVLVLNDTTLAATTSVSTVDEAGAVEIDTANQVSNSAVITDQHSDLDINVGTSGAASAFTNFGTIHALTSIGPTHVDITSGNGSSTTNLGKIAADGPGNYTGGTVNIDGAFDNGSSGSVVANNGTINVTVNNTLTNAGSIGVFSNGGLAYQGTININLGGNAKLINSGYIEDGQGAVFDISAGVIQNSGRIANGAAGDPMTIDADIFQSGTGEISIDDGILKLGGRVSGGTVGIYKGEIEFDSPTVARGFNAMVNLGGPIADLKFDNVSNLSYRLQNNNSLMVYAQPSGSATPTEIADIRLVGDTRNYATSTFKVIGGTTIEYVRPVTPPNPPTGSPPTGNPPAGNPPTGNPPAGSPPTGNPPAGSPPTGSPPTGSPPAGNPPAGNPPTGTPPAGNPPTGGPPTGNPPAGSPPAGNPPTGSPPTGKLVAVPPDNGLTPTLNSSDDLSSLAIAANVGVDSTEAVFIDGEHVGNDFTALGAAAQNGQDPQPFNNHVIIDLKQLLSDYVKASPTIATGVHSPGGPTVGLPPEFVVNLVNIGISTYLNGPAPVADQAFGGAVHDFFAIDSKFLLMGHATSG